MENVIHSFADCCNNVENLAWESHGTSIRFIILSHGNEELLVTQKEENEVPKGVP